MNVKMLLANYKPTGFFIFDSHQDAMNEQEIDHQHQDRDYIGYGYNIHKYNQVTSGAFFLYRRPGKLAQDHRFHIYGGGIVESISKPDAEGNVIAKITCGFALKKSIDQGESFIEDFKWKTREKPGPGWKGFWVNYGMNKIKEEDFWNLIENRECEPVCNDSYATHEYLINEENESIEGLLGEVEFLLTIEKESNLENRMHQCSKKLSENKATKIDFEEINKNKKLLGTAGELLAYKYEIDRLKKEKIPFEVEYVAKTQGDGLGYDILSFDKDGNEIHIEVKTTRTANRFDFYMSNREIEESKKSNYKVYRIYNFDEKSKTASMEILEGAISDETFKLQATTYKVIGPRN